MKFSSKTHSYKTKLLAGIIAAAGAFLTTTAEARDLGIGQGWLGIDESLQNNVIETEIGIGHMIDQRGRTSAWTTNGITITFWAKWLPPTTNDWLNITNQPSMTQLGITQIAGPVLTPMITSHTPIDTDYISHTQFTNWNESVAASIPAMNFEDNPIVDPLEEFYIRLPSNFSGVLNMDDFANIKPIRGTDAAASNEYKRIFRDVDNVSASGNLSLAVFPSGVWSLIIMENTNNVTVKIGDSQTQVFKPTDRKFINFDPASHKRGQANVDAYVMANRSPTITFTCDTTYPIVILVGRRPVYEFLDCGFQNGVDVQDNNGNTLSDAWVQQIHTAAVLMSPSDWAFCTVRMSVTNETQILMERKIYRQWVLPVIPNLNDTVKTNEFYYGSNVTSPTHPLARRHYVPVNPVINLTHFVMWGAPIGYHGKMLFYGERIIPRKVEEYELDALRDNSLTGRNRAWNRYVLERLDAGKSPHFELYPPKTAW